MRPDQATRCPSCKTVFRVVADQLRVSEGWVRCGRCTNVFNAAENMVDMDGSWARLADEPEDAPRRGAPADIRRSARGQAHRARQDGPDTDRLASKIETAMARAQQQPVLQTQPQPRAPQPQAFFPPVPAPETFEFDNGDGLLPPNLSSAPQVPLASAQVPFAPPAPARPVDITLPGPAPGPALRRSAAPSGFADLPTAPPTPPWHEEADPQQALRRELRHDDADDWPSLPPSPPPSRTPLPERGTRLMESLQSPAARRMPAPARETGPDSSPAPLHQRAAEPSPFDETRPENEWAVSPMAASLDDLRADPRAHTRPATAPKPGFMRQVERQRHWRQPQQRLLLLGAVAAGVLLLLLQATLGYKDLLAARFPATRPALEGLCAGLGCTVQAARLIDGLSVESSGLVRVDRTAFYRLQVTLRNRVNLDLALPALDVTFTDSKGDVISRKVLLPQELGSTIDLKPGSHGGTVAAGREVTLQGTLQTTGGAPDVVAGYTVELFYP